MTQSGDVGVETTADVLNVEDESVDFGELVSGRFAAFAVKTINGKAGAFIDAVGNGFVEVAVDAVLGTEEHLEMHVGRVVEHVNRRIAAVTAASWIRDEADAQSFELGEVVPGQDVDAVEDAVDVVVTY